MSSAPLQRDRIPDPDEDGNVTLTLSQSLPAAPDGTIVHFVARTSGAQAISTGDSLVCASGSTDMFPVKNGSVHIMEDGLTLTYRYNDKANSLLVDVRDPDNPNMSSLSIPDNTALILPLHAHMKATGIAGDGGIETRRTVSLYKTLGTKSFEVEKKISLNDLNVVAGSAETQLIGDPAKSDYNRQVIKITGTDDSNKSLLALKQETLQRVFRRCAAHHRRLSELRRPGQGGIRSIRTR